MDAQAITTMITTVGFPIVMCLLMYKQMNDISDKHAQEMESMKDALNNNTLVLQKLTDALGDNVK